MFIPFVYPFYPLKRTISNANPRTALLFAKLFRIPASSRPNTEISWLFKIFPRRNYIFPDYCWYTYLKKKYRPNLTFHRSLMITVHQLSHCHSWDISLPATERKRYCHPFPSNFRCSSNSFFHFQLPLLLFSFLHERVFFLWLLTLYLSRLLLHGMGCVFGLVVFNTFFIHKETPLQIFISMWHCKNHLQERWQSISFTLIKIF